jgi:hypothetical protein
VACHECLRERLARFEACRALRRSEQQTAIGCERVGDADAQRQFRSDDREIDPFMSGNRQRGSGP